MAKYFILVSGEIQFPFEIHEKIVKLHRHENGCHGNSKSLDISRTVWRIWLIFSPISIFRQELKTLKFWAKYKILSFHPMLDAYSQLLLTTIFTYFYIYI